MFNILTYVQVAPATADIHIFLEVPTTDKIHLNDQYGQDCWTKSNNGIYNTQNSQPIRT